MIRGRFEKAKEEVDSDLAVFAADLVGVLEKNAETHPEWQETIEDLLILARSCAMTSPNEFWLQCEGIVQELDDRRQELPPGTLKQLHTRMLFILTRCTRLLQFHKESGLAEDGHALQLRQSTILKFEERKIPGKDRERKSSTSGKLPRGSSSTTHKSFSQEQQGQSVLSSDVFSEIPKSSESPSGRQRITSFRPLPSPGLKRPEIPLEIDQIDNKLNHLEISNRTEISDVDSSTIKGSEVPSKDSLLQAHISSKHQQNNSWGMSDESSIICRICEEEVPTLHVEDHSRICAIADRCDQKGLSVNERLLRIAETLEKMTELPLQKDFQPVVGSPDATTKVSNSSLTEESDAFSPKLSDWSRRGSEDMLDSFPEVDNAVFMDDLKGLSSMSCKTRFGPKSDQGMTTSSAGSMTPKSPLLTPRTSQIDLLLSGKVGFSEHDDYPQVLPCIS